MSSQTKGLYSKYKSSPSQISKSIKAKKISPIYEGIESDSISKKPNYAMCEICYLFYPLVNRTKCCGHVICSECLCALFNIDTENPCPFCRHNCNCIDGNLDRTKLMTNDEDEKKWEIYENQMRQGIPSEIDPNTVEVLVQATGCCQREIIELLQAGLDPETILNNIQ